MIIILFLLLPILVLMASSTVMPIWYALLLTLVLLVILHTVIEKQKNRDMSKHHQVNRHTLYHNLKHGDIVFSRVHNKGGKMLRGTFDFLLLPLNYGLTHMGLIKEENGIKYIIDGYMGGKTAEIQDEKVMSVFGGPHFRIYKTPLMHFLNSSYGQAYQVFRNPDYVLTIPDKITVPENRWLYFCSSAIYPVLEKNELIHKESEKVLSYQPDSIMYQLSHKGYKCFYMIHDRELDIAE